MAGRLYIDEIDDSYFEQEWEFVQAVMHPKGSLFCVGTNKRGFACRSRVKVIGDLCRAHKDQECN